VDATGGGHDSVMSGGWPGAVLAALVMATAPARAPRHVAVARDVRHDFHVSYTRMAVEGAGISAQIRMFGDDITKTLVTRSKTPGLVLNSPAGLTAAQAYLATAFPVLANGRSLAPSVVSATQERDMWAYIVTWAAPSTITTLSMHNAVMMESFDDQQNIVKLKHIGTGKESTLFYSGGSRADQVVRF
jgi:hypothetical protein